MGEKEVMKHSVKALSEADGLVMLGSAHFHMDGKGGPSLLDDFGDEDRPVVGANAARVAMVTGNIEAVKVKDFTRGWGSSSGYAGNGTTELVRENEYVVETVIGVADVVQVHRNNIPCMVTISRKVKGANASAANLAASTDTAVTRVGADGVAQIGPIVAASNEAVSAMDAEVAGKIMVGVQSPGMKPVGEDDAEGSRAGGGGSFR